MSEENPYMPTTEELEILNGGARARYEDDPDTKCGIGSLQPRFLQGFARIGAFVGVYSVGSLLTSTLSIYVNSQVPMLEKQFGFSSAEVGVLMACNDIGYMLFVLFAGYFASKFHIPRVLGFSTILYGICGIVCALPYFLQDQSTYDIDPVTSNASASGRRTVPMCDVTNASSREYGCSKSNVAEVAFNLEELRIKRVAYWLIAFGMVFQGMGKSVRIPLVTLYIDDAVDKRKTGFYIGIITSTGILGPFLAQILGGVFSKIYVTLQDVDITPTDPRWIGAWWLGFFVFGAISIVFSVPTMCFPRKLRSKSRRKEEDGAVVTEKKQAVKRPFIETLIFEIKGFVSAMIRLFTNPVYSILLVSSFISIFGVAGALSFMPKYVAAQYSIPLWKANIILAISNIASFSIGSFMGGILTRRISLTPVTTCKVIILLYLINIGCQMTGFILGCDRPAFVGDNINSTRGDLYTPTNTTCLEGCSCNDEKYFPVCGDDGITYYSPCHAGCQDRDGAMGFLNCTCISTGQAQAGLCDQGCSTNLYVYSAFTFVGRFATALMIIPKFIIKVRCVDDRDRGVAVATSSFLISVIGWLPASVIFGMIIDQTCTLWKYTCGERQSCLLYDANYFRAAVHAYGSLASTVAMVSIIILYVYFRFKGITTWRSDAEGRGKNLGAEGAEKENRLMEDK